MKSFTIALIQNIPDYDTDKSINRAFEMVEEAARCGAALVSLPEMFYHPFELDRLSVLAEYEEVLKVRFSEVARKHSIYLCTGSFVCRGDEGALYNRSFTYAPDGSLLYQYSKCHLFDVALGKMQVKESALFAGGAEIGSVDTDIGRLSTLICYDIRFPEIARKVALQGTEVLIVPAVFNQVTGPVHWELFMRCRAVENQLFLAAVSQGKNSKSAYQSYGHSMVVTPWGEILAQAGEGEEIIYAHIDKKILEETRRRLPLLENRRTDIYN